MAAKRSERGVTLISVMLLVLSLLSLGLLVVRSSVREVTEAGQLVARERAMLVAQAAADYAAAQLRVVSANDPNAIDAALAGYNPQGSTCAAMNKDCIPGLDPSIPTGQRVSILAGGDPIDCSGRACMRQGAVVRLPTAQTQQPFDWCAPGQGIAFNAIVPQGDPEARVCVWVRNNASDALGENGSGSWTDDNDGRVVVTAMATVRGTTVTIEEEVLLSSAGGPQVYQPQSPDDGYGGGHNNDNSTVNVCQQANQQAEIP